MNWHQAQATSRQLREGTYKAPFDRPGYALVTHSSDGQSVMALGEDEPNAKRVLAAHLENQPNSHHYLYYNGVLTS